MRVKLWGSLVFWLAGLLLLIIILGYALGWPGNWWPLSIPVVTLVGTGIFLRREARVEEREWQEYDAWLQRQPPVEGTQEKDDQDP